MNRALVLLVVLLSGCAGTADKIIQDARRADTEFRDSQASIKRHSEARRDEANARAIDRGYIETLDARAENPRRNWPTDAEPRIPYERENVVDVFARLHKLIMENNGLGDEAADTREFREQDHGNLKVEWAGTVVQSVGDLPWWMQLIIQIVRPVHRMIADFKWQAEMDNKAREAKEKP